MTDIDSTNIDSTTTPERQRTVHFNPRVRARDTLSHRDMSPIERRAYWIQEDEYQAITRRNARIVRAIERSYDNNDKKKITKDKRKNDKPKNPDDLCPRGLESGLRSEYKTRETAVMESLEEVFNEQEKQYYIGVYDDEAIAAAYSGACSKSVFRAQLRAMLDRKETEDFMSCDEGADVPIRHTPERSTGNGKTKQRITGSMLRKQIASIRSWVCKAGSRPSRTNIAK